MMTKDKYEKALKKTMEMDGIDMRKAEYARKHRTAVDWFSAYGMPYRISINILGAYDGNMARINDCYPMPGYNIEYELPNVVYPDDFDIENPDNIEYEKPDGTKVYSTRIFEKLKPEIESAVRAKTEKYRYFKGPFTPEWEKYFAHLFVGYDFDKFTWFDFTGASENVNDDCDIVLLKNVYSRIQENYNVGDKSYYMSEDKTYSKKAILKYQEQPFNIIYKETE